MTSTPVSIIESTNESWIELSDSQSPVFVDNITTNELLSKSSDQISLEESIRNLGIASFQVERYLEDDPRQQHEQSRDQPSTSNEQSKQIKFASNIINATLANDSFYNLNSSNSDISLLDQQEIMLNTLKSHYNQRNKATPDCLPKSQLCPKSSQADILDCLSDSISLLDRLSEIECQVQENPKNLDWFWDWTNQPEYFCGYEWKIYAPKHEYLSQQRQLVRETMDRRAGVYFTRDIISLLLLTNILSIVIGAGLTYGIVVNRST